MNLSVGYIHKISHHSNLSMLKQDIVTRKLLKQGMSVFLPQLPHIMKQDEWKESHGKLSHQIKKKTER
jgi:hypothetical protein